MSATTDRHIVRVERCDPSIGRQLRGALRGRAVVVTARPADRQFGRISTLGSDLLTALGYLGTGTASRVVENDLQRVLPFLATAPERDVIVRSATYLKAEGISAITLLCAAAAVRLWLIDDIGASASTRELIAAKAGHAVTQQQFLESLNLALTPEPRRRLRVRTLHDVVLDAADRAGLTAPSVCSACAAAALNYSGDSRYPDDPWQDVLTRAASDCTADTPCTPAIAMLLFDVGLLSRFGLHLWIKPTDSPDAAHWHRDALRPALFALGRLCRRTQVTPTAALLKGLRISDLSNDAAVLHLAGQTVAVPAPLRLPLQRQRLTAQLRTAIGADRLLCFANQDIPENVWRSLAAAAFGGP